MAGTNTRHPSYGGFHLIEVSVYRELTVLLTVVVASCYRNNYKLGPVWPLRESDLTFLRGNYLVRESNKNVKTVSKLYLVAVSD